MSASCPHDPFKEARNAHGMLPGTFNGEAIPMLLRRGGHPLRRLHFLKELDERGLIDDNAVGNRGGII